MIEKIYVLSLKRCTDRHQAWLGASQMRGIPLEIVEFVEAHDDKMFEDMDEIAEYARVDGFPFVEEYAIGTKTEFVQQTKGSVCQVWNFSRILRHISQNLETALLLIDDKMLSVHFNVINTIAFELINDEDEFFIWQLSQRGHLDELHLDELSREDRYEQSYYLFNAIFHQNIPSYKDFFLTKGINGYDENMVLSPQGANWILGALERADDFYIFYDHFIANRLRDESIGAIEHNKGIYSPKESGFEFVNTIMPMGTTTNYAPKESVHFKEATKTTEITWGNVL